MHGIIPSQCSSSLCHLDTLSSCSIVHQPSVKKHLVNGEAPCSAQWEAVVAVRAQSPPKTAAGPRPEPYGRRLTVGGALGERGLCLGCLGPSCPARDWWDGFRCSVRRATLGRSRPWTKSWRWPGKNDGKLQGIVNDGVG